MKVFLMNSHYIGLLLYLFGNAKWLNPNREYWGVTVGEHSYYGFYSREQAQRIGEELSNPPS